MPPGAWSETFRPFSATHAAVVLSFIVFVALSCSIGRLLRRRSEDAERRFGLALGWLAIAIWLLHQVYWVLPANFTWSRTLPLHLCDVAGLLAPLGLMWRTRWSRALLYFWGIALCSQGLITPVLTEGPATAIFWFFFGSHFVITGFALYDVLVRGFRPGKADLKTAWLLSMTYALGMFALDAATGWNYGYMGRPVAAQRTILDLLGPWPWRVPILLCIGTIAFIAAWLPWRRPHPGLRLKEFERGS